LFIDALVVFVQARACGCLSRSGWRCEQAGSQVFGSDMLRFLAETVWRCCFQAALKPFLTYLKNNTCRRLIFIFLFYPLTIFSRKGVWGNTKSYCLQ
jgi:hypothetical protein